MAASERSGGEEFLTGAAAVGGKDRQSRQHLEELADPADNSIRQSRVIVAVAQEQRLSHAVFEAALVVHAVRNVKGLTRMLPAVIPIEKWLNVFAVSIQQEERARRTGSARNGAGLRRRRGEGRTVEVGEIKRGCADRNEENQQQEDAGEASGLCLQFRERRFREVAYVIFFERTRLAPNQFGVYPGVC